MVLLGQKWSNSSKLLWFKPIVQNTQQFQDVFHFRYCFFIRKIKGGLNESDENDQDSGEGVGTENRRDQACISAKRRFARM